MHPLAIARTTAGLAAGLAVAGLLGASLLPAVAAPASPAAPATARWHAAAIHVPAGGSAGVLDGIACAGISCVAGGSYYHAPAGQLAMIAAEAGGHWGTATAITLPANAQPKNGTALIASVSAQNATLFGVACHSADGCTAAGSYVGTASAHSAEAMAVGRS